MLPSCPTIRYGVCVVDGLGTCVCEGLWAWFGGGVRAPDVIPTTLSAVSPDLTPSLYVGNVGTIDVSKDVSRVVCVLNPPFTPPHIPLGISPASPTCPHLPPLVIGRARRARRLYRRPRTMRSEHCSKRRHLSRCLRRITDPSESKTRRQGSGRGSEPMHLRHPAPLPPQLSPKGMIEDKPYYHGKL